MIRDVSLTWDGGTVSGRLDGDSPVGVVLAHGAGTNQDHPMITGIRDGLVAGGLTVLTFNYPYAERGSRGPDRPEKLLACHRGAGDHLAKLVDHLFLAGRSMGGRMGTMLLADGYPAEGAILYAYPLHPPGKPDRLRIAHLPAVFVPMLFFQGTRDALSRMDLFDSHVRTLPNATVELLEGADHSFRGKGWNPERVTQFLVGRSVSWLEVVSSGGTARPGP